MALCPAIFEEWYSGVVNHAKTSPANDKESILSAETARDWPTVLFSCLTFGPLYDGSTDRRRYRDHSHHNSNRVCRLCLNRSTFFQKPTIEYKIGSEVAKN